MGDGEIGATPTYTEIFESVFPYYLAMGMSYEQFWFDEPKLVAYYRKADEIRKRRMNEELWLSGIYTSEALASTVGNMFAKGQKHHYPSEPKPITLAELEEKRQEFDCLNLSSLEEKLRWIINFFNVFKLLCTFRSVLNIQINSLFLNWFFLTRFKLE